MINLMKIDEVIVEEPTEVKQAMCNYFKKHFDEQWRKRPNIGGNFQKVNPIQAIEILENDFTEAEVWEAIRESDGNKAPGPDGFNMMCFQKGWKVMKEDIMNFMKEFHKNSRLGYGINCSFVTLLSPLSQRETSHHPLWSIDQLV